MKRKILLIISIVVVTVLACACGGKTETLPQDVQSTHSSEAFSGSYFGSSMFAGSSFSALDYSGAGTSFSLTNATGHRVDSLIIRNSLNEDEVILLSEKNPFENWEERTFFCSMTETKSEYTAEIKLENDTKFLLHNFPLGKSVKMIVVYEKNIGYLIYDNLGNGKMISTLDQEFVLSGENIVNAGKDYGDIQNPYNEYYQNPYADYDQPPIYVEPDLENVSGRGSKDGCLDGGLFW